MNAQILTRPIPAPPRRIMLTFKAAEYARLRALAERERRDLKQQIELLALHALADAAPDLAPDPTPTPTPTAAAAEQVPA